MILVMCEVDPGTGEVVEFSLESLALARSLSQAGGGVAVRERLDQPRGVGVMACLAVVP